MIDVDKAAKRLAAAKSRVILAEASGNADEWAHALLALEHAEQAYVEAVKHG